eukprot:6356235-Amphidinium_carterae.1
MEWVLGPHPHYPHPSIVSLAIILVHWVVWCLAVLQHPGTVGGCRCQAYPCSSWRDLGPYGGCQLSSNPQQHLELQHRSILNLIGLPLRPNCRKSAGDALVGQGARHPTPAFERHKLYPASVERMSDFFLDLFAGCVGFLITGCRPPLAWHGTPSQVPSYLKNKACYTSTAAYLDELGKKGPGPERVLRGGLVQGTLGVRKLVRVPCCDQPPGSRQMPYPDPAGVFC